MKAVRVSRISCLPVIVAVLCFGCAVARGDGQLPDAPQPQNSTPLQQNLPDAPAPNRTAATPKSPPPATTPAAPAPQSGEGKTAGPAPAAHQPAPVTTEPVEPAAVPLSDSARDQLFTLTKNVNFVLVPVTVKDSSGRLVEGLLPKDFSVYEDGQKQNITFFTSDPFPLSAAVVLDTSLPSSQWDKVKETLSALVGAFSEFDEISLFTYSNIVRKVQDFTGIDAKLLTESLRKIRATPGSGGVPVVSGPMTGGPSPNVNGRPFDPSIPPVQVAPKESYVLNDAILAAANELGKREVTRRRILFVISDGREFGSSSSYAEVLRVLLTRQITVYAVGIDSGIPGYRQAQKLRIPGFGYGDILPKYASATGGQVYAEVSARAIEDAYSRITEEARNQYTIGYTTRATPATAYRSIEVRVHRPALRIFTRDGYYPLPPGR
jgi:VWFA-related protein